MPPNSPPSAHALAAERFINALRLLAGRRRRVAIDDCFDALHDSDPFAIEAVDKRARLAEILTACSEAGVVESSKATDRGRPALPRSVRLLDADVAPIDHGRDWPWRAELAWVAELRLTAFEFATLRSVQEFLRGGGAMRRLVPHRERSLELFDHEKALDTLVSTRLFAPDRLTLELMRCWWAPPPLAFERVGDGSTALVVENAASYHSCVAAARPDAGIGVVVYGAGRAFIASVAGLRGIPGVKAVLYIGDLDAAGLAIPHAADVASAMHGAPAVRPAARLWAMLLKRGRPQPAAPVPPDVAADLCAWLPAKLQDRACKLLVDGYRVAQEAVGIEVLSADTSWCSDEG